MTLCSAWVGIEDVRLCSPQEFGDGIYQRALLASADMLYQITRYRWPGICTDTVRPCRGCGAAQLLQYPNGGYRQVSSWDWGWPCGCTDQIVCGGTTHSTITLPGTPIVDVTEILIDGAPFTAFKIANDRSLIRTDGQPWPIVQDLTKDPATDAGTMSIEYRYGSVPGPAGAIANERLACELAKSWDTDCACDLSPRVTQLVHEGETIALEDLTQALDNGKFGIREVDWWVESVNGNQPASDPGARVLMASEMFRDQRVR